MLSFFSPRGQSKVDPAFCEICFLRECRSWGGSAVVPSVLLPYVKSILLRRTHEAAAFVARPLSWHFAPTCLFGMIFTLYSRPWVLRCFGSTASPALLGLGSAARPTPPSRYPSGAVSSPTAPWPHPSPPEAPFHWPQWELDHILIGYWEDELGLVPAVVHNTPFHHEMKTEVKLILTVGWILTLVHLFWSVSFLVPNSNTAQTHIFFKNC